MRSRILSGGYGLVFAKTVGWMIFSDPQFALCNSARGLAALVHPSCSIPIEPNCHKSNRLSVRV